MAPLVELFRGSDYDRKSAMSARELSMMYDEADEEDALPEDYPEYEEFLEDLEVIIKELIEEELESDTLYSLAGIDADFPLEYRKEFSWEDDQFVVEKSVGPAQTRERNEPQNSIDTMEHLGETILYDPDTPNAWISSPESVDLEEYT